MVTTAPRFLSFMCYFVHKRQQQQQQQQLHLFCPILHHKTKSTHQIARDINNAVFTYFELFQKNHFQHQLADCWIAHHL